MKNTQDKISSGNILPGAPEDVPLREQQEMWVMLGLLEPLQTDAAGQRSM